ncbi:OTU-like cysteine protease, putative [Angomonas deanei]|uniref:Ubiquitin thioesterase OTU n=1 Tax=Angomonas deanei TaxID=59799 RepID=A0A7G2C0A8_9TRYP|nr:OTU-like cysteine protease, putative [Angomonas deanei]
MLKLRLRTPGSQAPQTLEVDETSPLILLLTEIENLTNIPQPKIKLLTGFPPKPLAINPEATLKECNIRNNDMIIVQEGEATVVEAAHTGKKYVPPVGDKFHFTRRVCPADNSCLFHACAYVLHDKSRSDGPLMRQKCLEAILSKPDMFNETTLGMSAKSYATIMANPNNWGGGIELEILSMLYETEIFALDLQSSTIQKFGTDRDYSVRAFLVYTGNHYDCIAMNPNYNSVESDDVVLFNTRDDVVLRRAVQFVKDGAVTEKKK